MNKKDILSMDLETVSIWMQEIGEPTYRGKQIYNWLHKYYVTTFYDMTNLPKVLIEKLDKLAHITRLNIVESLISKSDGTRKYLYELEDRQLIETVFMSYKYGNSVCVSSQAGCRMGCTFCASGMLGLSRQLTTGEMLKQVYQIELDTGERVSHVVIMGTGEPLDNYDNVLGFIRQIINIEGKNMSQRHITISTCGLVEEMIHFAEEGLQVTLAVSLHASNDDVRKKTMPIARKYSIDEILGACEKYFNKTGRRITFEYGLIEGVNDSAKEARELAKRLKERTFKCHVNLIPINPVAENKYKQSDKKHIIKFSDILKQYNIEVTIRRELGKDIQAACGQLRLGKINSL